MFQWEFVLGLVQQLVTKHQQASVNSKTLADEHADAAKRAADLHQDVKELNDEKPPAVLTHERLVRENETLKRMLRLVMKTRKMFPEAAREVDERSSP